MRVDDNLEKELLKLEENNGDNILSILDVAKALETTYYHINNCLLKDEKDFSVSTEKYRCKKEKYDAIKGKTIYNVYDVLDPLGTKVLFNIEISNIGEINFEVLGEDKEEVQKLIEKINEASEGTIELVKMNADVSFFAENRELVISEEPYLALKMGNFMEGEKTVLVYKNVSKGKEINKTNDELKFIRVDQIEGYLKNIKLDERRIPILAYAFLNRNNEDKFKIEKFYIMDSTYPYLTEEKVRILTCSDYLKDIGSRTAALSFYGAFAFGGIGLFIGSTTAIPLLPSLATGIGLPITTGIISFLNTRKNVKRAHQKEELLINAHKKLYRVIKTLGNQKVSEIEKEMSIKRKRKMKESTRVKQQELNPKEIIVELKRTLKGMVSLNANLYFAVISQLENAYGLNNSLQVDEEVLKDKVLYGELLQVIDEIYDLPNTQNAEILQNSLSAMRRLLNYGDSNKTIENLNTYTSFSAFKNDIIFSGNKDKVAVEIKNLYLEAMLISKEKDKKLSIQTIASIHSGIKSSLVELMSDFANRITYLGDNTQLAEVILHSNRQLFSSEIKLVRVIDLIHENNLTYDLLGKNLPKAKVKVKEQTPKVD